MEQKLWMAQKKGYSGVGKHRKSSAVVQVEKQEALVARLRLRLHPHQGNRSVDFGDEGMAGELILKSHRIGPLPWSAWGSEVDDLEESSLGGEP
jgi:hypothetical protein